MYILDSYKKRVVNSDFVEQFCVAEKEDAVLVVAVYHSNRPTVTLSRYANVKEAQDVLMELFCAASGGQQCFYMPESVLYAEERIKKDARTKRRGGS